MRKTLAPLLLPVVVSLYFSLELKAQYTFQAPVGLEQFGASQTYDIETVDLSTLNIKLDIPILTKPGRGLPLNLHITHANNFQLPLGPNAPPSTVGWQQVLQNLTGLVSSGTLHTIGCSNGSGGGDEISAWYFTDANQIIHEFPTVVYRYGPGCGTGPLQSQIVGTANDGSGLVINIGGYNPQTGGTAVITSPSGLMLTVPIALTGSSYRPIQNGQRVDANGNIISVSSTSIVDTLGVPAPVSNYVDAGRNLTQTASTSAASYPPPPPTTYTYRDSSGTTRTITVTYQVFAVGNVNCDYTRALEFYNLPVSISLGNSTQYTFTYEQLSGTSLPFNSPLGAGGPNSYTGNYTTGRIASVTKPSGETINYTYNYGANDSYSCTVTTNGETSWPSDGGLSSFTKIDASGTWTYARVGSSPSNGPTIVTTVTDPYGYTTVYTFLDVTGFKTYAEVSKIVYSGSITNSALQSVSTCYNGEPEPCINQTTSEFYGNIPISADVYTSNNGESPARTHTTYATQLYLPTEVDDYDFGGTTLLRSRLTQYATFNGIPSNKPSQVTIENSSGVILSQTIYGYDEQQASPTNSVTQHSITPGNPGNLTSVKRWNNLSNTWSKTSYTYDNTGNVTSIFDARANAVSATTPTTIYGYQDNWFQNTGICPLPGNTLAFATSQSNARLQNTSSAYEPCAGTLMQSKTANDIVNGRQGTLYTYTSMGDPLTIAYPDGGGVSANYNNYAAPLTVVTTQLASPNPSVTHQTIINGLTISDVLSSDPYGADASESISYSNVQEQYLPYRGERGLPLVMTKDFANRTLSANSVPGGAYSTWSYNGPIIDEHDAKGNHSQMTLDALGRMIRILEPDTSNNPTIETDYQYDLLDNLVRVDQWGGLNGSVGDRVRRFSYNSLSELIAEYNPENTFVQTTPTSGYTQYPAAASCAVAGQWTKCYSYDPNGNVTSMIDNRGITITLQYDLLNRLTSKSFSVNTALNSCFLYDQPIGSYTDANPVGMLTMEWTQAAACPTTVSTIPSAARTLRIYSLHDSMGRVQQDTQCPYAPCVTLFSLNYAYDVAGNVISASNGLVGSTLLTFGATYDAAGRTASLAAGGTNSLSPMILFQANSQTANNLGVPYGPMGLTTAQYGVIPSIEQVSVVQNRTYDAAGRLINETDQSGSSAVFDSDQITIGGSDGVFSMCGRGGCVYDSDQGSIVVSVGDFYSGVAIGSNGSSLTDVNIASEMASALTSTGSPVTATAAGNVVTLVSKVAGTAGAYPVSINEYVSLGNPIGFTETLSEPALTGSSVLYSYSIPTGGFDNQGNITSHADSVTGSWSFQYDQLNRLKGATASAGLFSGDTLSWSYDNFGNRLTQTPSGSSPEPVPAASTLSYSASNQVQTSNSLATGFHYDAAGNVTNDGWNQYSYDAAGRLCAVYSSVGGSITGYVYDAEGTRTAKVKLSSLGCPNTNITSLTNQYLLDSQNRQLTELSGTSQWQHTNVFSANGLLATYDVHGLHFYFSDPLGSRRVQASVNAVGTVSVDLQCASLPFGDGMTCTGSGYDATEHHFTGKERDSESSNDYSVARYYSSGLGQFLSPDPSGLAFANPTNPQSMNLYGYALNNPLALRDSTGLYCDYSDHNDPASGFDQTQFDYHSDSRECDKNGGQWVNDGYTHTNSNGISMDDGDRPEYASALATTGTGSSPSLLEGINDLKQSTIPGLYENGINNALFSLLPKSMNGNPLSLDKPAPNILFGTTYCGPGGAGPKTGTINSLCAVHDHCYELAGLDASVNIGTAGNTLTPDKVSAAQGCNQQLYDGAARHPDLPGSAALQVWLTQGDRTGPFLANYYLLYPGTAAKP